MLWCECDLDGLADSAARRVNGLPGGGARKRSECRFCSGQPSWRALVEHAIDHAGGAADIEMRAERLVAENVVDGNEELLLVAIDLDAVAP